MYDPFDCIDVDEGFLIVDEEQDDKHTNRHVEGTFYDFDDVFEREDDYEV